MKTHSSALLAALAFTVAACSSPTESNVGHRVRLTISKTDYHPGDTVRVDVENTSSDALTFPGGFCPLAIQQFLHGAWTHNAPGVFCDNSEEHLEAHGHALAERILSDESPGRYRLQLPSPAPVNGQIERGLSVEFSVSANAPPANSP